MTTFQPSTLGPKPSKQHFGGILLQVCFLNAKSSQFIVTWQRVSTMAWKEHPASPQPALHIFYSATFPTKQLSSSPDHNFIGFLLATIPHTAFTLPPEDPNPSGPFFFGNLKMLNVQDYIMCTCYLLIPCVMLLVTASSLGQSVTFYKIILYTKGIHWWLHLAHLLSLTD